MWAPHKQIHINVQSTCHIGGLTRVTKIWTSREPISKFRDFNVHFQSSGTWITLPIKFKDWRCILFLISSAVTLGQIAPPERGKGFKQLYITEYMQRQSLAFSFPSHEERINAEAIWLVMLLCTPSVPKRLFV